jgi:hypothetical protein
VAIDRGSIVREATGQESIVQEATGQEPIVRDATGQESIVREATGQGLIVREAIGHEEIDREEIAVGVSDKLSTHWTLGLSPRGCPNHVIHPVHHAEHRRPGRACPPLCPDYPRFAFSAEVWAPGRRSTLNGS